MSEYQIKMEESFEVKRTAEDCFRYITDFSIIKEWDHTVVDSKKTSDGVIDQGTTFDVTLKTGLSKSLMRYKITEFDFPKHAVLIGEANSFIAEDTVTINPINSETTQVIWSAIVTFKGISAKIIPTFEASIKKNGTKTIEGLKEALENNFPIPKYTNSIKVADKLIFPGMFLFTKYGYNMAQSRWNPNSTSVVGKHMVLTGATSGLGLAAAKALAHKGAHLTLVARNETKAKSVLQDLIRTTGNSNITIEIADMSLMKDVLALSNRLIKSGKKIDVLVNNAGALFNDRKVTSENLEMSFALLLLGPYILTEALLPIYSKNARVVNVSSGGMYSQKLIVNDLQFEKGKYNGSVAYARAKRGLVIATEHWAEENKSNTITFNSMHPGWADTPGVVDALPGFYKVTKPVLRTPEEGADTIVWLASAKEAGELNGSFLLDRTPHPTHLMAKTRESEQDRKVLIEKLNEFANSFKK